MKKSCFLLFLFVFLFSPDNFALPNRPMNRATTVEVYSKENKKQNKATRKKAKIQNKLKKLERKLEKKGMKRVEAAGSVWDDDTFKLGAIVALGGLLLTVLGVLPVLGGVFTFIGTLMMIAGIALMIWILIESY